MVLVTAFGREEVQREADSAGFAGFLFKPIGQSALVGYAGIAVRAVQSPAPSRASRCRRQQFTSRVLLVEDNR
jgi:two-component system sensor histidine kinase/response regulator